MGIGWELVGNWGQELGQELGSSNWRIVENWRELENWGLENWGHLENCENWRELGSGENWGQELGSELGSHLDL